MVHDKLKQMNNKPTIAAIIILIVSLLIAFQITVYEQDSKISDTDTEIFVTKLPVEIPDNIINQESSLSFKNLKRYLVSELKAKRNYLYLLTDSYEVEISDFWKEVLNTFEIFEYYKGYPEAFIRRLVLMPTFTGCDILSEEEEGNIGEKPLSYPDYDYRSIKYRISLVPNTIKAIKAVIDYFYFGILYSLGN